MVRDRTKVYTYIVNVIVKVQVTVKVNVIVEATVIIIEKIVQLLCCLEELVV